MPRGDVGEGARRGRSAPASPGHAAESKAAAADRALARLEPPPGALEVLPDTDRYKCRYKVASESSGWIYMVSFDAALGAGYWVCSCPGCVTRGQCKHLTAAGLRGRAHGKDLPTLRALGLLR